MSNSSKKQPVDKSKDYTDMYSRVMKSIHVYVKQKKEYRDLYSWEAEEATSMCVRFNLIPEEGHVCILFGKAYLQWRGLKYILEDSKIYWVVRPENKKYSLNKNGDLVCSITVHYRPFPESTDLFASFDEYLKQWLDKGVPLKDIYDYALHTATGVGVFRSNEQKFLGDNVTAEAMSFKRALQQAFNYCNIINAPIDYESVSDMDDNSNYMDTKSTKSNNSKKTPSTSKKSNSDVKTSLTEEEVSVKKLYGKDMYEKLHALYSSTINDSEKVEQKSVNGCREWVRSLASIKPFEENAIADVYNAQVDILQQYFVDGGGGTFLKWMQESISALGYSKLTDITGLNTLKTLFKSWTDSLNNSKNPVKTEAVSKEKAN